MLTTSNTETQATIEEWATATFGPPSGTTLSRVLIRANEEMAELIRRAITSVRSDEIAEEAADVVIVLSRASVMTGGDITRLFNAHEWSERPAVAATHANGLLAFLIEKVVEGRLSGPSASIYVDLIVSLLARLVARLGRTLQDVIDAKMAVNREREWAFDGTGCAYHVDARAAS
jgi:NTP pyrophosphatase (non-canonical NTP hydrolase)